MRALIKTELLVEVPDNLTKEELLEEIADRLDSQPCAGGCLLEFEIVKKST